MDEQLLFYIAVAVISFVINLLTKKKKPAPQSEEAEAPEPTITFEDLLREFKEKASQETSREPSRPEPARPLAEKKRPVVSERKPMPVAQRKPSVQNQPNKYQKRDFDFKDHRYPDDDEIDQVYQRSLEADYKKKHDPEYHPEYSHFKEYEEKVEESDILKDIQETFGDRDKLARAFIISEILQRKY